MGGHNGYSSSTTMLIILSIILQSSWTACSRTSQLPFNPTLHYLLQNIWDFRKIQSMQYRSSSMSRNGAGETKESGGADGIVVRCARRRERERNRHESSVYVWVIVKVPFKAFCMPVLHVSIGEQSH